MGYIYHINWFFWIFFQSTETQPPWYLELLKIHLFNDLWGLVSHCHWRHHPSRMRDLLWRPGLFCWRGGSTDSPVAEMVHLLWFVAWKQNERDFCCSTKSGTPQEMWIGDVGICFCCLQLRGFECAQDEALNAFIDWSNYSFHLVCKKLMGKPNNSVFTRNSDTLHYKVWI